MPTHKTVTYTVYTIAELKEGFPDAYEKVIEREQRYVLEDSDGSMAERFQESLLSLLQENGFLVEAEHIEWENDDNHGRYWVAFEGEVDIPTYLTHQVQTDRLDAKSAEYFLTLVQDEVLSVELETNSFWTGEKYTLPRVQVSETAPDQEQVAALNLEYHIKKTIGRLKDQFLTDMRGEERYQASEEIIYENLEMNQNLFLDDGTIWCDPQPPTPDPPEHNWEAEAAEARYDGNLYDID